MAKKYEDITLLRNPKSRYTDAEINYFYEQGLWERKHLSDYLDSNAKEYPDKLAVYDTEKRVTFTELRNQAYCFSSALLKLGVGKGDRVVVQLPGWVEYAVAYYGITRIGAVMAPAMHIYREHELLQIIDNTTAKLLIIPKNFRNFEFTVLAATLKEKCASLEQIIVVGEDIPSDMHSFKTLVENSSILGDDHPLPSSDDLHVLLQTSGTEAKIKSCAHTWNTVLFSCRTMGQHLNINQKDVCLMPSPVTHTTGLALGIVTPMIFGASSVLLDPWDPEKYLDLIQKEKCTYSVGATPFMTMALSFFDPQKHDVSSFRCFASGGAPVPSEMVLKFSTAFDCAVITVYGCSETLVATITRMEDSRDLIAASDGRALTGITLRVTDEAIKDVAQGEEGEVIFKSPGLMLGYWGAPDATLNAFDGEGWFHSGDLAKMVNGDGYIRISGRKKDIIIRGGVNISAREIEEELMQHPKVQQAAVVAMPDERLGEKCCAFIVPKHGLTPPGLEELVSYLTEKGFARHKLPERVEPIATLPVNATGKIQKFQLRNLITKLLEKESE